MCGLHLALWSVLKITRTVVILLPPPPPPPTFASAELLWTSSSATRQCDRAGPYPPALGDSRSHVLELLLEHLLGGVEVDGRAGHASEPHDEGAVGGRAVHALHLVQTLPPRVVAAGALGLAATADGTGRPQEGARVRCVRRVREGDGRDCSCGGRAGTEQQPRGSGRLCVTTSGTHSYPFQAVEA